MWPLAVELLYVEMVLICRKNGGHGTGLQPCESGSSPEGCDQWREMRNRRPGTQLPFLILIFFNIFQWSILFFGPLSAGFNIFNTL